MPKAIIVDWYGPFESPKDFRKEMRLWQSGCRALYMGLGRGNVINYIGLTTEPATRFYNHAKLRSLENLRFYCGEVVSQAVAGRRTSTCPPDLKIAEHALIAFFQPKLNARLTESDPDDCVVVYSRFFDPRDGETPRARLRKFPPVIAYNSWAEEWEDFT